MTSESAPLGAGDAATAVGGGDLALEVPTAEARQLLGNAFEAVEYYGQMLRDEGELRGLIGPRELPRLWSRHLLNCAAIEQFIPHRADLTIADVGSGAGLPGIVVACMRPDAQVFLIEAMGRRIQWLQDVCNELDLDNVELVQARSSDLPKRAKFDVVTARAVANMTKLVRIAGHLVAGGGQLLALKGQRADQEVEDAKHVLRRAGFERTVVHVVPVVMDDQPTRVVQTYKRR